MLVLSRRPDEKILLPTVPAVFKVLSSQTGLVRLGIEAPAHVPILREELTRSDRLSLRASRSTGEKASSEGSSRHVVRNHLNNLNLALTLLRMQMSDGAPNLIHTLDGIQEELRVLREILIGESDGSVSADTLAISPIA